MMLDNHLSRLYYASTATEEYTALEIGNILESCRKNNPPLDVTGMLFLGNNFFFQCLEGPRENVNKLYQALLHDSRHANVQLLELKEVGSRYFEEWSMKYVRSASVISKILKETGMRDFNPYRLDTYTLNAMAEAFRDHQDSEPKNQGVKQKKSGLLDLFKTSRRLA